MSVLLSVNMSIIDSWSCCCRNLCIYDHLLSFFCIIL